MGEAKNSFICLIKISIWLKDYNITQSVKMQNEAGEYVDLYIPRKCSASNRIIGAGDHASVQINIAEDDEGLQDLRHLRQDPRNGRKRRQPHPTRQEGRHSSTQHLRRMTTIWPPMTAFFRRTSEKNDDHLAADDIVSALNFLRR